MKLNRVVLSMLVMGLAFSFSHDAKAQCAIGDSTGGCTYGSCSSSNPQIYTPIDGYEGTTFIPQMGYVSCCGGYVSTMVGILDWCYYTNLRDPRVQERLVELGSQSPVYVPTCDGWLRPFHPLLNRSQKPA